MGWVTIDALEHHWSRARVNADIESDGTIQITTINVTALSLNLPIEIPSARSNLKFVIDGKPCNPSKPTTSGNISFHKVGDGWKEGGLPKHSTLRKKHNLQGPIDDAFMGPFIFVRPTGKAANAAIDAWTRHAMERAIAEWRLQFRGEPRVMNDDDVTASLMTSNNVVVWGDLQSNKLLARMASQLPFQWSARGVRLGSKQFDPVTHIPVLIYPNPLSPERYVVVNSGFTFADAAPTSNALQVPELPDWAVIDMTSQKVASAGFFDEQWRLIPER
jgi:hypothetical protein